MSRTLSREPTLSELCSMIWKNRVLLIIPVFVMMSLGIVWLRMTPAYYTASMTIGPTAANGVAGRGARLTLRPSDNDNVRSAPVELDKKEELSDFARFIELLTSVEVAKHVSGESPDLLRRMFSDEWDTQKKDWSPPQGFGNILKRFLLTVAGQKSWTQPDAVRFAQAVKDGLIIEPVGSSAMRRIRFRHPDREFAVTILRSFHYQADEYLRNQARVRTGQEIDYIKVNLGAITQIEHRRALAELLASQEQTQMMINVNLPFAADKIEDVYAPALPDWPVPGFVIVLMFFVGAAIGTAFVYYKESREIK